jgi:hypothetical protein
MKYVWAAGLIIILGLAMSGCSQPGGPSKTDPALESLVITRGPDKTEYGRGEPFDPAGLVVKGVYKDGTSETLTDYTFSNFDTDTEGETTVTVSYGGKSAEFTITVGPPVLMSLELDPPPAKLVYGKGEQFNAAGMVVKGIYSDGEIKTENDFILRGTGTGTTGEKTAAVTAGGKTVNFTFVVSEGVITEIRIVKKPRKLIYSQGEALDLAGMTVEAVYSDVGKVILEMAPDAVTGYDPNIGGSQTVTVGYSGKRDSFTVIITGAADLYFDYGRRRASTDPAGPGSYTVPLDRALVLAPVKWNIPELAVYAWTVDGVTQSGVTGEYFSFTPAAKGNYTVRVSAGAVSAETLVVCVDSEGTYRRTGSGSKKPQTVFEFTPAPGQFVTITTGATEETVRLAAQAKLDTRTSRDGWCWSLGAWGGYVITGFDHSVENRAGYDLYIAGNAFPGWSEPGIVWVSQDDNGNGVPDDTWYELKGSHTLVPETKRRYAVTYYKGDDNNGPFWMDNAGNTGSFPGRNYYGEIQGYPHSVKGDYITFTGTCLPSGVTMGGTVYSTGFDWGYVDDGSSVSFDIANAIQADGSAIALSYIDFVKVHTAVNSMAGILGEISTETGVPYEM